MTTVDPTLSNRDLAPTLPGQRTWGTYNYIALWFSMSMEITTYQLASSLIAKGMDWKQAVLTVLLGNLIVLVPMLLNAHAWFVGFITAGILYVGLMKLAPPANSVSAAMAAAGVEGRSL